MKATVTQPEARSPGAAPTSRGSPFPPYFFPFEQGRARRLPAAALPLLQRSGRRWELQEHQLEQMPTRPTIGGPARPSAPLAAASGTALLLPLSLDRARSPLAPTLRLAPPLVTLSPSLRSRFCLCRVIGQLSPPASASLRTFCFATGRAAPFPSFPARRPACRAPHWAAPPGPAPSPCAPQHAVQSPLVSSLSVTSPLPIGGGSGSRFRCGAARPGGASGAGEARRDRVRQRRDGAARAGCGGAGCSAPCQRLQRRGPRRAPQRLRARPARTRHTGQRGGSVLPPGRGRQRCEGGGGGAAPGSGVWDGRGSASVLGWALSGPRAAGGPRGELGGAAAEPRESSGLSAPAVAWSPGAQRVTAAGPLPPSGMPGCPGWPCLCCWTSVALNSNPAAV